jgi:hypothetical protein
MLKRIPFFWNVILCCRVDGSRHFEEIFHFHLQNLWGFKTPAECQGGFSGSLHGPWTLSDESNVWEPTSQQCSITSKVNGILDYTSAENLKTLKCSHTDAAAIAITMRHAERKMGLVWNLNNVGKTSQPLLHSTFHTLSFYGTFSDVASTLSIQH